VFNHIAEEYGFAIDTMGVVEDHVHIFLEAPPRYAPAEVVQITKNITGRELFKKFPKIKKHLWRKSCGTIPILSGVLDIKSPLT
jgi:putative transposase